MGADERDDSPTTIGVDQQDAHFQLRQISGEVVVGVKNVQNITTHVHPPAAAASARTNIVPRPRPFVERREAWLPHLATTLGGGCQIVVISGGSGTGKSELALRYAERFGARYPGGRYVVTLHANAPPPELAKLGYAYLDVPQSRGDRALETDCSTTLARLGATERTLLIYDNVPNAAAVQPWLPPSPLCDCLITTTWREWPYRQLVPLKPLDAEGTDALLTAYGIPEQEKAIRQRIAATGGGLPWHLCPEASAAAKRLKLGLKPRLAPISDDLTHSLDGTWSLLSVDGKHLMVIAAWFEPRSIPEPELRRLVGAQSWEEERYEAALEECFDRCLLDLGLQTHDLTAKYVRGHGQPGDSSAITDAYVDVLLACVRAYDASPNDADLAVQLASYPWRSAAWLLQTFLLEVHGGGGPSPMRSGNRGASRRRFSSHWQM